MGVGRGHGEASTKVVSVAVFIVSGIDVGALSADPNTVLFFVGSLMECSLGVRGCPCWLPQRPMIASR